MSLRVWLPLNGSLENKGLDDVTVINNGATVDNNGKIGKCYSFDGSNDYFIGNPAPLNSQIVEWSYCCWFKPNKLHNGCLFSNRTSVSETGITLFYYSNYIYFDDGIRWNFIPSTAISVENWNHLVFVRKTSCKQFYLNGILINETSTVGTNNNNMNSTHFAIGGSQSNNTIVSGNMLNGKLNDVRIYDHALSPMEVKQISQGLVLHYPLNHGGLGQENLLKNTNVSVTNGSKTGFVLSQTIPSGTKVTFSLQIDAIDLVLSGSKRIGLEGFQNNGTNNSYKGVWITGTNAQGTYSKRIFATVTLDRDFLINNNTFGIYVQTVSSGSVTISNPKIEIGEKVTPWCPNSSDTLATTMGLNDTIEYDCSGYGNNGQYYKYDSTGDYFFVSDTPRYSTSLHIASANPTVNAASGTVYLYGHCGLTTPEQLTIAFWCKPIEGYRGGTDQGQFCTTNYEYGDAVVGSDYQGSAMNQRDTGIDINDSESSSHLHPLIAFDKNEWHHYVVTYDGKTGIVYKDGQSTSTKAFSEPKALASFIGVVIGFSKAGGVWRRNDSYYSDFRVYCTALSPEDVLDLYNLGAAIDTNNNLYGAMFEEV